MEVNNNSLRIEDVGMIEIDKVEFINRNYCTLESKVKVLDYLKEYKVTPYKSSEAFKNKYSVGAIYKWKKNENLIRETAIKKPKNLTLHKGKSIKYEEIEEKLIEYITININAKNPLTIWSVVSYYEELVPENSNVNYKAKYQRIYRLLKKYGFCIRRPTRQGHLFPLNSHVKIIDY